MASEWGAFQSLIQLSVALNTAFVGVGTFFLPLAEQEARKLRNLAYRLKKRLTNADGQQRTEIERLMTDLRLLRGDAVWMERHVATVIQKYLPPFCALATVAGLILLIISSFLFDEKIGTGWIVVVLLTLAPFTCGLVICSVAFYRLETNVSAIRRRAEQDRRLRLSDGADGEVREHEWQ
jgi:hypothetical protein